MILGFIMLFNLNVFGEICIQKGHKSTVKEKKGDGKCNEIFMKIPFELTVE